MFTYMNERIQLILKTKNISASKFADEIGVQRSSISHIISGRNNPSLDFIQKILKRFPDINSTWILTGKGSMYLEPDLFSDVDEHKNENIQINNDIIDSPEDIINEDEDLNDEFQDVNTEIQPLASIEKKTVKPLTNTESDLNENNRVEKKIVQSSVFKQAGKRIERIVIFYSDKSCIEYNPE